MEALGCRQNELNKEGQLIELSEDEVSIEDCELMACCSGISNARDLLYRCQEHGGLIYRDVREIVNFLESSGHGDILATKQPILNKIFGQLNILKGNE
jgi:hypothetical protein